MPLKWSDHDPNRDLEHQLEQARVSCLFWACIVLGLAVVALWPWE
jgi:hypothetical protein